MLGAAGMIYEGSGVRCPLAVPHVTFHLPFDKPSAQSGASVKEFGRRTIFSGLLVSFVFYDVWVWPFQIIILRIIYETKACFDAFEFSGVYLFPPDATVKW